MLPAILSSTHTATWVRLCQPGSPVSNPCMRLRSRRGAVCASLCQACPDPGEPPPCAMRTPAQATRSTAVCCLQSLQLSAAVLESSSRLHSCQYIRSVHMQSHNIFNVHTITTKAVASRRPIRQNAPSRCAFVLSYACVRKSAF